MNDETAEVSIRKRRARISPVWLIPLAAILIGCWLVYQNFISRGPEITLLLDTAEGLKAGSTAVKVHSVEVGHVKSVRLTDDYNGTVAVIQMNPGTWELLAADSKFWVVKPRIGRHGISGLGTILSGAYIQLQPGSKPAHSYRFTVLEHPPVTSSNAPGVSITLTSDTSNALNVGDPVIYQGRTVGLVETAEFSVKNKRMRYRVFIQAPYNQIITQTTQFWLRSGIDIHIGADGMDVRTGSLQSIFTGGVTFGLPKGVQPGNAIADGAHFKLYATRNAAREDRFDQEIRYLVLLKTSVRGLSEGAPVLYRGIRIGTVKEVPYYTPDYDFSQLNGFRIPVLIAIEPQRISDWIDWPANKWRTNMKKLFEHGLRASIKSANLLTGAMLISLKFVEDSNSYKHRKLGGLVVFPSTPAAINSIQQQISDLLEKFNQLELNSVMKSIQDTLKAIESTTQGLNRLVQSDKTQRLAGELQDTLEALQKTLNAYQQGTPVYQELSRSLSRFNRILSELAPLLKTLNKNPNALIFGSDNKPDPIPQAAQ